MRVLYLTPDLFGSPGGIARHCKIAIKALTSPESNQVEFVDVIALMDPPGSQPEPQYVGPRFGGYDACGGNRSTLVRRTAARLLATRYDVVVAQHVNLAPLLLLSMLRMPWPRRVTVVHGLDGWMRLPAPRRLALQRSDVVIAVSDYTARRMSHVNKVKRSHVRVVYNCLDPAFTADGHALGAGRKKASILTVSRLWRSEASKGHAAVLRALPRVVQAIPRLSYDVVGDGDLRPDLQYMAEDLGIQPHVRFLGCVSDSALRDCYQRAEAYVMPSKWEGFGLTFLEAMAAGCPVIAGDRDATPEVVGDAALLVDPDDTEGLADAMIHLLSDADLRSRLAQLARQRIETMFTYERFKERFINTLTC
jgi:glycosyltransferase involved in cell wall biosynthesis